ncbi:MAG: UDP-N-acetylglucosamine 2-epimerase (non-hydrolyzing) [Zetaproteobacteria bacterium]|nr:MAG: UDP-N-acetylglucosamine 2-epimerase (non-hydrolyzing) [Zetaproteobacteria bacterium]
MTFRFKVMLVAGARPNFMKIAPMMRALAAHGGFSSMLVHTGQHYDEAMSATFFEQLGIPEPDENLGVGSGSHAVQTARIMERFEPLCQRRQPDAVVVVGDVNSTIAAGLVATKLAIPLVHVEAGLRSYDRSMPEEINRLATDAISDLFFATEEEARANLLREGHDPRRVHLVGHVMVDNLFHQCARLDAEPVEPPCRPPRPYFCLTLHRPANVDDPIRLERLLRAIVAVGATAPVLFPCHPRTEERIRRLGWWERIQRADGLHLLPPLPYNQFLALWRESAAVLTDSGGLQEETTALGIPCLTLRENTERPVTVTHGTNTVIGDDPERLLHSVREILAGRGKRGRVPPLWDGRASVRIAAILHDFLRARASTGGGAHTAGG